MSFLDNYPTEKTQEEKVTELKLTLSSLIATALRKTSSVRKGEGLVYDEQLIAKMAGEVRSMELPIEGGKSALTLRGVFDRVLEKTKDPEIISLNQKSAEIGRKKQEEFEKSIEYQILTEVIEKYGKQQDSNPDAERAVSKVMKALGASVVEYEPGGKVKRILCRCDESEFILPQYDNAVLKIADGTANIKVFEEQDDKTRN